MRRTRDDAGSSSVGVDSEPQPSDDLGFIGRWSQRKRSAVEQALIPEPQQPTDRAVDGDEGVAREPEADAEGVTFANDQREPVLPPLDSLDAHSDYSGFLSPDVDRELRRLALRKLFHLPSFNLRDGLDDYDDDFTQFAKLGDIVTRDMRYRMEVDARREAEKARAAADAEQRQDVDESVSPTPDDAESEEQAGSEPLAAEGSTDTIVDIPELPVDPEQACDPAEPQLRPSGTAT